MRRIFCFCAVGSLAAAANAGLQITEWTNPGSANWWSAVNWTNGVPTADDWVFIDNGGEAHISGGITPDVFFVFLGSQPGAYGRLRITNSPEVHIDVLSVGNDGDGELMISGDPIVTGEEFSVGSNLQNSTGLCTMIGGTIDYSDFVAAGYYGNGYIQHDGADVITAELLVARGPVSVGNYVIEGGTITATNTRIAERGHGTFTHRQSASTSLGWMTLAQLGGTAICNLEGGYMEATQITRTGSGTATFNFTGGTLNVGQFGWASAPFDLLNQGGALVPGGFVTGTTQIYGNWTQQAADYVHFDLESLAAFDQGIVNGQVNVGGTIGFSTNLNAQPVNGDTFTLIDNDGADPINGTFIGYPEGSTVSATHAGQTYNFTLSYVGGDGNDMVLIACLADGSGDGTVDFDDLNLVLSNWGMTGTNIPGDLDGSGTVDFDDLNLVLNTWGASCA